MPIKGLVPASLLALVASIACAPPPPPAQVPEPEVIQPEPFPFRTVWTARDGVELREVESGRVVQLRRGFVPLEAQYQDSLGLRVRCLACPEAVDAYVALDDVVFESLPPEVAAWGELGAFALAVRESAAARDVSRLQRVMTRDFSFSFIGEQTPETALAVWASEGFATLDAVPDLLDSGLSTRDGRIWSAPPEFTDRLDYRGPRIGFRRAEGGPWEWVFLVRSVSE